MIDIFNNEVRNVALLRRHVIRLLDTELSSHGLGHGSYKYLYALYLEDCRSQQALADVVGDDKAAATRTLTRLEREGFISRQPCPADKRVILVSLSDQGLAVRGVVIAAVASASQAMTHGLTTDEAEQFRALLAKAVAGLGESS